MCNKPLTFIQIKTPGEAKSKVKPIHSASLEEQFSGKKLEIPCGKCASCKVKYAYQWADRTSLEARYHEHNYFITLTYNNDHLPTKTKMNKKTGELEKSHSIKKEHLRKFIKNVRNYYYRNYKHTGIKFFACGEYGGKKGRPHYHVILFNLPINDLTYFKHEKNYNHYTSKTLEKLWGNGYILITDYGWRTGNYIAQYITKREDSEWSKNYYKNKDIEKEFITMSNGIGKQFLLENKQSILDNDLVMIKKNNEITYSKTFKYYLRLLEEKYGHEDRVQEIKNNRELEAKRKLESINKNIKITEKQMKINAEWYSEKELREVQRGYEKRTGQQD